MALYPVVFPWQKVLQTFRDQNRHKDVIEGYHGLLIENFEVDRTFFTAVEVTAGSRLFFHLVETDKVGTVLLKKDQPTASFIQSFIHSFMLSAFILPPILRLFTGVEALEQSIRRGNPR